MVSGGWQQGVFDNISNSKILSSKVPSSDSKVNIANYIVFKAKEGKVQQLAELLTGAAEIVKQTEPKTIYWFALQLNDDSFAIFDAFNGADGQQAHFAGKVAAALKNSSDDLVENGWDKGVVANIKQYKVITNI